MTGEGALEYVQDLERQMSFVEGFYQTTRDKLEERIQATRERERALEKELARLKSKLASSQGDDLADQAREVKGRQGRWPPRSRGPTPRLCARPWTSSRTGSKSAAIVLGTVSDGRVSLVAGVTADLTAKLKAGELVNFVAQQVGGKGGGRPDMAQAGGAEPAKLPEALRSVQGWVERKL